MPSRERSFGRDYFEKAYGRDYDRRNPPVKWEFCLRHILKAKPSGKLLDVGCGPGNFLAAARRRFDASGCDVSEYALRIARTRLPGLDLFRAAIRDLSPGAPLDVVTCFDVLEHLPDPGEAIGTLARLLKDDGVLALSVPVYDGPAGWVAGLLDRDESHVRKEGRRYWRDTLRAAGFDLAADLGLWRYLLPGGRFIFFGGSGWRDFSPAILLIGVKR